MDVSYFLERLEFSVVEREPGCPEQRCYVEEPPKGELDQAVVEYYACRGERRGRGGGGGGGGERRRE